MNKFQTKFLQYFQLFEEVIPRMHAVINDMIKEAKNAADKKVDVAKVEKFTEKLLEADKFLIEKLYIVQLASVEGWKLANQVKCNLQGNNNREIDRHFEAKGKFFI